MNNKIELVVDCVKDRENINEDNYRYVTRDVCETLELYCDEKTFEIFEEAVRKAFNF